MTDLASHSAKLGDHLARYADTGILHLIGGVDLAPGARDGQSLPTATHWNVTTRHPIGPVGVITPWNTPFMPVDLEDRAGLGGGLHNGAQTGRTLAPVGPDLGRELP